VPWTCLVYLVKSRGSDFIADDIVPNSVAAAIGRYAFHFEECKPNSWRKVIDQKPRSRLQGAEDGSVGRGGINDADKHRSYRRRRSSLEGRYQQTWLSRRHIIKARVSSALPDSFDQCGVDFGRDHAAGWPDLLGDPHRHCTVASADFGHRVARFDREISTRSSAIASSCVPHAHPKQGVHSVKAAFEPVLQLRWRTCRTGVRGNRPLANSVS
jgi:hypothetical protein